MMDYINNVYENGKFVCTVGGSNMYYDDIVWDELIHLLMKFDDQPLSKEELDAKLVVDNLYLRVTDDVTPNEFDPDEIDLTNKTITMPEIPVYEMDEEIPCIKVVKKEEKYFAEYEDGFQIEMPKVYFDRTDLFKKKVVTFEEFLIVANFFNNLMYKETDGLTEFILNDNQVIRFNTAAL